MNRIIYYTLILLGSLFLPVQNLSAQQEDAFAQFMYYKQAINPAQTGSSQGINITGLVRNQWIGLSGAPKWQSLLFSMPLLNNRVGVGGNIYRHTIGITQITGLDGSYAYRLPVPRGFLSFGLQTSVRFMQQNFGLVTGTQPIEQDESIPVGLQSKYLPNFGAGIYYESKRAYVGLSVPRLLRSNINFSDKGQLITRETQHYYFMAGATIPLGESWELNPQTLWRYLPNAPFDADINLSAIFKKKISGGLSYRIGSETAIVSTGLQLGDHLHLGMAFEASFSDIQKYNSGTAEVIIRYFLASKKGENAEAVTPRFY
ncbi:MAG: type IX secretion system membrane protein PorP/SprF [Saprospiraceae bacterium]|nr:type IX secretion system membrane protein PorP/SprF [Saprospiraceae bacterium]